MEIRIRHRLVDRIWTSLDCAYLVGEICFAFQQHARASVALEVADEPPDDGYISVRLLHLIILFASTTLTDISK